MWALQWSLCVEKMTIHQSVEIRAVMRNQYSLIMNLNAINKTWALINKNTVFKYKKTRFDWIVQVGKITFENASISWRLKIWQTKIKQELYRLRVSKILSTKKKTPFGLYRFDRGQFINISIRYEICKGLFYGGYLFFDWDVINSMGARPSQKSKIRKKVLSKTNFHYSQGGKLLILLFEPKGNDGQCMWCKICCMCANIELTLRRAMWIL